MKWHVGQRVYVVWRTCNREETITKVGRHWAYLGKTYRCDDSGHIDGGQYASPGKVWESKAEYDKWYYRKVAWESFRRLSRDKYHCPDGVTAEDIEAAIRLLRLREVKT